MADSAAHHAAALQALAALDIGLVRRDEPLAPRTTWRIGGSARLWVEPTSVQQFAALRRFVHREGIPCVVIGRGSNLLIADEGFDGVVVGLGPRLAGCAWTGRRVRVQAGLGVPRLALRACQRALAGLEHTAGIPGTVGGLIAMNGGSERQAIGSVVRRLTVVDASGQVLEMTAAECEFAYRTSVFQRRLAWVLEAELELPAGDPAAIRALMRDILAGRRKKFPRRQPNCGSVFLSLPEIFERFGPPGKVIEDTGCKGWRVGGAEVSRLHANFIVNTGGATAADVLTLIHRIRAAVHARTGMWMQCEVRYVAPDGRVTAAHDEAARRFA